VTQDLKPRLSIGGLNRAVRAGVPATVVQRAGYLFETLAWAPFADALERALPARVPATALQTHGRITANTPDPRWTVVDNIQLRRAARA
jgi:hypothetical protein